MAPGRRGRPGADARDGSDYGPRGGSRGDAAYSADGYGRTLQRERPPARGGQDWNGRDEIPRTGRGHRPGHGAGGPGGPGGTGGRGSGPRGPGGDGRRSFKQWLLYGSWWRHWTWKKALAVTGGAFLAGAVLLVGGFFIALAETPIPTDTTALARIQPSQVYYSDGRPVGSFSENGVDHQILDADQIPNVMKNAIIAAEDRHFYSEGGISPTGILRAAFVDLKGGSATQGGSTLTEQFVKNYYSGFSSAGNTDKSATDKLKQMLVAVKLAHGKSKSWILTQYLNTVYFGQSAYGVGAAAETYFDKKAAKLDVAQAAMLAALVNDPSGFSTDETAGPAFAALKWRWKNDVLKNMVRDGAISQAKYNTMKFPKIHLHFAANMTGTRGYVMSMVKEELESTYGLSEAKLDGGGLKIYTTINQSMMKGLASAVVQNKELMAEGGVPLPSYAHIGATLIQPRTGAILAFYGGPGWSAGTTKANKRCNVILCDFNMAEAPEPVGSSFKPYVLAEAVKQGMNVQTSILNGFAPLWIPPDWTAADRTELSSQPKPASTFGWDDFTEASENTGPTGVAEAAAISSDPAFLDLVHRTGVQSVLNLAGQFGVGQNPLNADDVNDLTGLNALFGPHGQKPGSVRVALGDGALTTVEQADTFAMFAADGQYSTAHIVSKIVEGGELVPSKVQHTSPLSTTQAADVDYALSFDNQSKFPGATGYPNAAWDRPVIAKTGTLGNGDFASEAWFNGSIPQASLSVNLFTNKQTQNIDGLGGISGGLGGTWPAKIWHTFMSAQYADSPIQQLPTPDYTGYSTWNQITGDGTSVTPSPTPTVSATPTPSATPTCTPGIGQACIPGGTSPTSPVTSSSPPTPTQTPTSPTPTCTPSPGNPCLPGTPGQGANTAASAQPGDEASSSAGRELTAVLVRSLS